MTITREQFHAGRRAAMLCIAGRNPGEDGWAALCLVTGCTREYADAVNSSLLQDQGFAFIDKLMALVIAAMPDQVTL